MTWNGEMDSYPDKSIDATDELAVGSLSGFRRATDGNITIAVTEDTPKLPGEICEE